MWQTVFVEKHKVALPPSISNIDTRNVPKDIASPSDLLLIQLYVERLKRALSVVMETPRLATLQSPSGYNAEQLLFDADRFLNFQLNPVMAAELNQNDPLVQSRLRMFSLEKRRLESIKANVSQSINELTTLQNKSVGRVNGQQGSNEAQSSQLALNEDALSSVINLAQKAQLNDYLVELFTKSDELATQLADIDMEVGKLTFDRFEGVTVDLSMITAELNSLITEFDLLMDVWTNESLRASQEMYNVAVPAQLYGNELEFNDRSALMLALATVLGLFVAMAIAFIRAAVRQKNKAA